VAIYFCEGITLYTNCMEDLPELWINLDIVESNFKRVHRKLSALSIDIRPHVKTIHLPHIAARLVHLGLKKICVSNLNMLAQFLNAGFFDIAYAIPVPLPHIPKLDALIAAEPNARIELMVDHMDQLHALDNAKGKYAICIEIDTGQFRSGVRWLNVHQVTDMIQHIMRSKHSFSCISSHFGYLYDCPTKDDVVQAIKPAMMKILNLKEQLDAMVSFQVPLVIGDTPSVLAASYFENVSEIRAGNFLFNDLIQLKKGGCEYSDIACVVKATIISITRSDCRCVIHCGSVYLSKEKHPDPSIQYGQLARVSGEWVGDPLPETFIAELYQEHAVVYASPGVLATFSIGQTVAVIPVHSCLTADALVHKDRICMA
jgi:D-serine deaminase-like pyridoxal phosphate-dependent protein